MMRDDDEETMMRDDDEGRRRGNDDEGVGTKRLVLDESRSFFSVYWLFLEYSEVYKSRVHRQFVLSPVL
ncbi:hypothetical protein TNCV_1684941 [Trichonephila clavipes]|nr:hypothetical protein TNCV_1684941 [Trichonephila clavipes]